MKTPSKANQAGFSLVELLVGTVIGMLTILAIMYAFKSFEGQKRTTNSLAGAQSDGLMAMSTLDNAIRPAGVGLFTTGSLLCSSVNIYYNGSAIADGGALMPVVLTDGGSTGASDGIQTMTSQSAFGAASVPLVKAMPSASAILTANTDPGLTAGDLILVGDPTSPGTPCTVMGVTNVQVTGNGVNVQHNPGTSQWNPPNPGAVFANAPVYGLNARIVPLGAFTRTSYQSLCNSLVATDLNNGSAIAPSCAGSTYNNATPMAANVVNIQAQYGITSATGLGSISCWVNATGAGTNACDPGDWANPSTTDIKRIEAIHVAVTVMSPQVEKPGPGGICNATASTAAANYPVSWVGGPLINVTTIPNWKCFRYKVFQTIIPMRNAIWAAN